MDERDHRSFGSWTRRLVDHPEATRLQPLDDRKDIGHSQRDVVQTRAAFVQIPGDWRTGGGRFEQLQPRASDRDEMGTDLLRPDLLRRFDVQTESVAVERECRVEVLDGNPDVIENGFHKIFVSTEAKPSRIGGRPPLAEGSRSL
jgi:hypothetical protein